ncbi:MAG: cellulose biosynthesis protein [uncultured bacterium]|nr:MAG: cellulose biosynthesis protein [uncultured bacterium]
MTVSIREIHTFNKYSEKLWGNLFQEVNYATPYQTWEWNYNYWKYFGRNKQLKILGFEENCKLIGVLPLWLRKLDPISVIEPVGSRGTDYLPFLISDDRFEDVITEFLNWYKQSNVEIINMEDLPYREHTINILIHKLQLSGLAFDFNTKYCPCYSIHLDRCWTKYLNKLSKRTQKDIHYYRRRARSAFEKVDIRTSDASEVDKHFYLHQKIRNTKGDRGAYATYKGRSFIQRYAKLMEQNNSLKLMFLSFDNKDVASILGVESKGIRFNITVGYDPSYSKFRPGTLLYSYDIEDCISKGTHEYDLSRGAEPYKETLGASKKFNTRIVISKSKDMINRYLKYQKVFWKGADYAPTEK